MEQLQFCTTFLGDCKSCIAHQCFYIQFGTPNVWTCVDKLAGWKDVQRIISHKFPELCERISPITNKPGSTTAKNDIDEVVSSSSFEWVSSGVDLLLFLMMVIGFYIMFVKNRALIRAIEEIPEQVREIYARSNNYYHQLQQDGNREYELVQFTTPPTSPIQNPPIQSQSRHPSILQIPSLLPSAIPLPPLQAPPLPPAATHHHINIEDDCDDEAETSFSTQSDSSPEVVSNVNVKTKYGRVVKRPNFFGR
ncbi:unnamed protein product [Orchesella dallaii]|uniref:Uncharacterized protein n=1 Tax=Orchesella dallaii TaxID=48710 RepID=A0ABP1RGT9_9HEXA